MAQAGEDVDGRFQRMTDMVFHCRADSGVIAAQERVASAFAGERARQAGRAGIAQTAHLRGALEQCGVARVHGHRECGIGQGVFVSTADQGLAGQGGETFQRSVHLRRRPLEQAAAAQAEQGISAEQQARPIEVTAVESNVTPGMARDPDDREPPRANIDLIAITYTLRGDGNAFVVRGDHRQTGPVLQQSRHAADVVVVMMGQQDCVRWRFARKCVQHRRGLAGIDNHGSAGGVVQQPDQVVLEGGNRLQAHLSSRDGWWPLPQNPWPMLPTMPFSAFRRQPDSVAADAWFSGHAGQAVLASEAECLRLALRQRTGRAGVWLRPTAAEQAGMLDHADMLRLQPEGAGFGGDLRCELPLPLASESCDLAMVQHLADAAVDPEGLLEECARVLLPGGWLWLLALNPLSPYRWRWRAQGLRVSEPVTWRRRLRAVGLVPEPVSQGLGPTWEVTPDPILQDGAGLRAAFLVRAQKRRLPMTPGRGQRVLRLQAGSA